MAFGDFRRSYEPGGPMGTGRYYGQRAQAGVSGFSKHVGGRGRAAGIAGAGVAAYGAGYNIAPNAMTAGLIGVGAYAGFMGSALSGKVRSTPAGLRAASRRGGVIGGAARGARRGVIGAARRAPRTLRGSTVARAGMVRAGAAGIAGAAAGLMLGVASKALFGPSKRSNYGHR